MVKIKSPNLSLRNYNSDFVLDNFLEAEFRKILLPLHLLQCLTMAPKYSISYNLLTSSSRRSRLFTVGSALLVFVKYTYDLSVVVNYFKHFLNAMYLFLICLQLLSYFAAFVINSVFTVLTSETHAYLVILLQRIHSSYRFVKMEMKNTMIINWISLLSIVLYHIIIFTYRLIVVNDSFSFTALTHLFVLSADCNYMYTARVFTMSKNTILMWIKEYQHILNLSNDNAEDYDIRSHIARLEDTYNDLILVLRMCQSVFGIPMACFVVTTFTQAMSNVQTLIEESSWEFNFILALTWTLRNTLLLTVTCVECEKIFTSMKNVQVVCIITRNADISDATLTACGMLTVNAVLPASLLVTIATYAVVLLQIKFL
nr:gustatory receptor 44.1 [Papilio dardanus]